MLSTFFCGICLVFFISVSSEVHSRETIDKRVGIEKPESDEQKGNDVVYDFVKQLSSAKKGIILKGKMTDLEVGATFRHYIVSIDSVLKNSIYAHPPWLLKDLGNRIERGVVVPTVGKYEVNLPKGQPVLEFDIALRNGCEGRSDGVQFIVKINEKSVFDEVWGKSKWKKVSIPLKKWAGKRVTIAFITTPGPKGNTRYDHAFWGEPRIKK